LVGVQRNNHTTPKTSRLPARVAKICRTNGSPPRAGIAPRRTALATAPSAISPVIAIPASVPQFASHHGRLEPPGVSNAADNEPLAALRCPSATSRRQRSVKKAERHRLPLAARRAQFAVEHAGQKWRSSSNCSPWFLPSSSRLHHLKVAGLPHRAGTRSTVSEAKLLQ